MRTEPAAVIFDFDYTLADSSEGSVDCINFALQRMGRPPAPEETAGATIGLSLSDTYATLTGHRDKDSAQRFRELFVERADQIMAERTVVYPHVHAVTRELRERKIRLGIVSTKFRYRIEHIMGREQLLDRFDVIVGGEDVSAEKPDPAGLLWALEKLGAPGTQSIYVGDSVVDAQTAERAGVPFVAVLSGTTPREAFTPFQTLEVLNSLRQLTEWLSG